MQQLSPPRHRMRTLLTGASALLVISCTAVDTRYADVLGSMLVVPLPHAASDAFTEAVAIGRPHSADQAEMFELVNAYRAASGLAALHYSKRLEQAAEDYARRMYEEGFFEHQAPDGSMPPERAVAAGFAGSMVGENLAYGFNQLALAREAMVGLKNSPSHNENMLRGDWQYAGLGHFTVQTPRGEEHWWVQLFGRD